MSKITAVPLLEWTTLLPALLGKAPEEKSIDAPWRQAGEEAYWFSRSAWAIQVIATWWECVTGKSEPLVWAPDYFCNESLGPLRESGADIIFYPLGDTLDPDWDQCRKMAHVRPPDIFILVHYFGKPADAGTARRFCDELSILLVEDAAHVLRPTDRIGVKGDFVCYSPHKLLALPDGAVLIHRSQSAAKWTLNKKAAVQALESAVNSMPSNSPKPWLWLAKRVLQKLLPEWACRPSKKTRHRDFFHDSPAPLPTTPRQSRLSRKLLGRQVSRLGQYEAKRKLNILVLDKEIERMPGIRPLFDKHDSVTAPFLAVYLCGSIEQAKKCFERLRREGLPIGTWPDLPPEVLSNREKYPVAITLRHSVLSLPVHQGLSMTAASKLARRCSGEKLSPSRPAACRVRPYDGDRRQWNALLAKAGKSNLMQSWSYGEAKAQAEGWRVRRVEIMRETESLALLQVLEKPRGLSMGIARINRGPIMLRNDLDMLEQQAIYRTIRRTWSLRRGRLLLFAPELEDTPTNEIALNSAGFRRRKRLIAGSAWIDLSLDENELRKNLKGKWRNQLSKAEKAGLMFKMGATDEMFEWLMDNHVELMKDKAFQGPSVALLTKLRSQLADPEDLLVCQAVAPALEGETGDKAVAVGGVLLARHGASAVYLIGWNGPKGRSFNANNFLLWQAMLELKRRGCKWFDLGGINEEGTPHIAHFKRGVKGREYRLIGEWW